MGRHKEWRKVAKKMRRKRLRRKLAKLREELELEEEERLKKSPSYAARQAEEAIHQLALEEAEKLEHDELQKKWEEEEKRVREQTILRDTLLREIEEAKEKARIEKEEEIKRKKEAEEERQEKMAEYIYQFSLGQRCALPAEMLIPSETQPGKEVCPFFSKVAACRFWDTCSRNHIRPALSDTLLFPGFYAHFTMSKIGQAEYDTDMSLEYDDKETYSHFLEFYRDIRYEFESCGRLTRLIVCCNLEPHLRGNVYVSYASERETMAAYLKFNARYYAGKQLSCQFANIPSWKSAICGLFFKRKCPKGSACNFLHVFRDPGPPFYEPTSNGHSATDTWRWSESPERKDDNCNSSEKKKRKQERKRSSSQRRRSRSPESRRSRSRDRKRSRSKEKSSKSSDDDKRKKMTEQSHRRSREKSFSKERNEEKYSEKKKERRSRDRRTSEEDRNRR